MKAAARDLLAKLKEDCLVLDWRERQRTRAAVRVTIEKVLDAQLPEAYSTDVFQRKCDLMYGHVYDSYYGAGESVYSAVA